MMYKSRINLNNSIYEQHIFDVNFHEKFVQNQNLNVFEKVLKLGLKPLELYKISELERAFLDRVVNFKRKNVWFNAIMLIEVLDNFYSYNGNETITHFKRVGKLSGFLAKKYTGSQKFANKIEFYSSLHDIGKIGIPDEVLEKSGKLTMDEFEVIKNHTSIGKKLIEKLNLGSVCENIVAYHHEKWNGKGYHGLENYEIPLEARIVAIADVYDALREKRCYKPSFSHEEAKKIILCEKGSHFDPDLVDVFLENENDFKLIYDTF